MMLVFFFVLLHFVEMLFNLLHPCRGCGECVEVKGVCVEQHVKVNIAVVAVDDLRLWLQCVEYFAYASKLLRCHLTCLVKQDDVAELNLLYDEVLDVLFGDVLLC